MMMCKTSSDAHLFSHHIIDFSAQCFLPYARCYLAIAQSFRLFCRRLNANFTEDGPRGYVWHDWWMFLRGLMGNVTEWVKRSILSIVENYATAIYLFVCLIGIYKTRIVLGGLYVMGDTSSCRGFWRRTMSIFGRDGIDTCSFTLFFVCIFTNIQWHDLRGSVSTPI